MANPIQDAAGWSFTSGWVVALESQMVESGFYDRLLDAEGPAELISGLSGSLPADVELKADELKDAEEAIAGLYRDLMREIRDRSPFSDVADLLLWRRELRAFRNHVKRRHLEVPVSEPDSELSDDFMEALWAGSAIDAPDVFARVADESRRAAGAHGGDVAAFDAAFDSATLTALTDAARRTGSGLISGYWERYDTIKGVEFLWRAKMLDLDDALRAALIGGRIEKDLMLELDSLEPGEWAEPLHSRLPGLGFLAGSGEEGKKEVERLRGFVDAADRWLMNHIRDAKCVAFGPERVFGALVGLESEAYNMRVAVVGRANGISPDLLRRHLRAGYV